MVTQAVPSTPNELSLEAPHRRGLPATPAAGSNVVLERELSAPLEAPGEVAVPPVTKWGLAWFVAPLLSVYDWLAGPPLTEQDRRFLELEEADRIRRADRLFFNY